MKWSHLLVLLLPCIAFADEKPDSTRVNNRCASHSICKNQSTTGECVSHRTGDELVMEVGRRADYTFYSTPSTASDYSCDIHTSSVGFDAAGTTDQVNTTSITDEAPVYTMSVLLHYLWVACTTVTGGNVNIDVVICARE